ncbi:TonB-dependent receptor plug domain-containing protein [Derxia lacustris]|uniref:TonB-dependent receptor plug domain-containing protein n=1 Tax=Derxia lacustris TaxID=764842 RepID=UPI000A17603A|nr:TonB-dependent receptor [Derxia lacustris]
MPSLPCPAGARAPRPSRLALALVLAFASPALLAQQAAVPADPAAKPADAARPASAAKPGNLTLDTVQITGGQRSEVDARRLSTAPKTVIGRDEINQFGDSNVGDVLRRLPGVTLGGPPGRPGGDVRMRGLGNGYTMVLINGERIPPGFSIDTLSPEQIERIEIMKAPTAEFGTRAIAGVINIVLREALNLSSTEVKLETSVEHGRFSPRASLTRNDRFGDGNAYNFSTSVFHSDQLTETSTRTQTFDTASGALLADRNETARSIGERQGLHLGSRVQWRLAGGDQFVLMPFLFALRGTTDTRSQLTQPLGTAPYATSHTDGDNSDANGRISAQWQHRLNDDGARLQLDLSLGGSENRNKAARDEFGANGSQSRTLDTDNRSTDRTINNKGKVSLPLESGHSLVAGWEVERAKRGQTKTSVENGVSQLAGFGTETDSTIRTLAGWAQDEWEFSPAWSAYAGLRWEQIATTSRTAGSQSDNTSSVWSPLFHVAWKPDESTRDQVRLSLTRSYKAPQLGQLSGLPTLSVRPNDPSNADSVGNPDLKPELATGIDLAYEHYIGRRGVTSIGFFQRRITDLIRSVTSFGSVPWSDTPRWFTRPENVGDAVTRGIELEARASTDELWTGATPVNLKASVSFYRSHVDGIPGPDNRLDQQPKAQGSLSADGKVAGLPLTLGSGVTWTPVTVVQTSPTQESRSGTKIGVDVFGVWAFTPASQLRLAASNVSGRDYLSGGSIVAASGITQTTSTTQRTNPVVSVRWELKI